MIDCHNGRVPELREIETLLKEKFTGPISQIPPAFSALKIDGQRAYDLARKGESPTMKPRETQVKSVKIINYNFPELEVELTVAAGFYVRSFARDVGEALCGGGLCHSLRRTAVGAIDINNTHHPVLRDFAHLNDDYSIDPQFLIKNIVHQEIDPSLLPDWQAGRALFVDNLPVNGTQVLVLSENQTVGLAEVMNDNLQPRVVF